MRDSLGLELALCSMKSLYNGVYPSVSENPSVKLIADPSDFVLASPNRKSLSADRQFGAEKIGCVKVVCSGSCIHCCNGLKMYKYQTEYIESSARLVIELYFCKLTIVFF